MNSYYVTQSEGLRVRSESGAVSPLESTAETRPAGRLQPCNPAFVYQQQRLLQNSSHPSSSIPPPYRTNQQVLLLANESEVSPDRVQILSILTSASLAHIYRER